MATNGRNRITASECVTKKQVTSLFFRKSFSDAPDIIRTLRCSEEEWIVCVIIESCNLIGPLPLNNFYYYTLTQNPAI